MTSSTRSHDRTSAKAGGAGRGPAPRGLRRREALWCYAFAAPALVLALLFTFWPMVASWYYSLLDWDGFSRTGQFIGLENFGEALSDPYFWNAFKNSFLFTVVVVPVKMALGLVLAIVLNARLRFSNLARALFFIPAVTTTAIVGIVMTVFFDPTSGPVNDFLSLIGVPPQNFLGSPQLALPTLMGISVWKFLGITMVYWLAALQTVPASVYDAAKVDGAGWWRTQTRITWPLLRPYAVVILVIEAVGALRTFDLIQTTTGGGPFFASETMEVYIYRIAFATLGGGVPRLGYASAAGVIFGVAILAISVFQGVVIRNLQRRSLAAGPGGRAS